MDNKPLTDPSLRNLSVYGPEANCTLIPGPFYCDPRYSVYQYRPSLAANGVFIALYSIALIIHILIGVKYRTWFFMIVIACGCISEIVGYAGRILLNQNPFSFAAFLIQIMGVNFGPTWFAAAIYVTLSKIVIYLGPQYSRFSPKFYYWIFIPCDIISLCIQAIGGALSSSSNGGSQVAVDVSIAGLSFQVITITFFLALVVEYAIRYMKARKRAETKAPISRKFKIFCAFLALSILFILIRSSYRIDELRFGYSGPLIHNEPLFIALEGVMVIIALYCLIPAHPGPIFAEVPAAQSMGERTTEPGSESTSHEYETKMTEA